MPLSFIVFTELSKGKKMKNKVQALRKLMKESGIQAYLVPSSDPHQDEYVPDFWQRRKFICGFTGSAGDVVITRIKAGLWTDSRYFLQAQEQLDSRVFTLFKLGLPGVPSWQDWIAGELKKGEFLGVDPQLIPHATFKQLKKQFEEKGLKLRCLTHNLVDMVWEARPSPPQGIIEVHSRKYAGESVVHKLGRLREKMAEERAGVHIITQLDAIAWLFNIRGSDIAFNPVTIAYAIVTSKKAMLFLDQTKIKPASRKALKRAADLFDYGDFSKEIQRLAKQGPRIWVDETSTSQWVVDKLKGCPLVFKPSPITLFKAVKNKTETEGFRTAHIRDGAAMVKFLSWLDRSLGRLKITEVTAAEKVAEFRSKSPLYRGPSFQTISSYGSHGAIVHYATAPETDVPLKPEGIYLIDSGGQYLDATTDITRTVALGRPTDEQKDCFTRVLKGLIALSRLSFPQGTSGRQVDAIARLALWEKGLNYGHGTGHGVGTYLNVHEGPQAVSYYRCVGIGLESGMVTTIEPGYYKDNDFGLRLENIVLVVKDEERSQRDLRFFKFETLTLCPIDVKLIKKTLLTPEEINWLNSYHRRVLKTLSPLLDKAEAFWLKKATEPISHLRIRKYHK